MVLVKTLVVSGDYEVSSNGPLTEDEIKQGYVLACCCQMKGNISVDLMP